VGKIEMRIEKKLLSIVAAVALFSATPAVAVTDGELDGEGHPAVGLLIFDFDGFPGWRCSGTLISPTVMLTAGHCTDGASGGRVWFDADEADILAKGYPFGGSGAIEFIHVETHPLYPTAPFFVNDAGIVILSEPVYLDDPEDYGVLPEVDELDQLKTRRGKQNQMFTAVGYGLQRINPVFVEAERTRMVAYPHLIQINVPGFTGDFSLLLSNNHSTGGTCFGDSGGPNFIGTSNVIGGVTSFGINGNCAGTGGVFRVDRQNVLDFINTFLP
jgi:hypothetical protein